MPEARELLHSNLHEVFSERNPDRRWAAIGRTYTEDVTFIDPDGEFVGWQALTDQAQKLLDGLLAGYVFEEDGPRYADRRHRRAGVAFRAARQANRSRARCPHDPGRPRERRTHLYRT